MQDRHTNRIKYFEEQITTTTKYVIPYIENHFGSIEGIKVMEIGCGEGGNLEPFLHKKCIATGVDMSKSKIKNGLRYFKSHPYTDRIRLLEHNIYDVSVDQVGIQDLIIMRDTFEHIYDQGKFLKHLKSYCHSETLIFNAFPSWRMPFGGHQQVCKSKIQYVPYIHLLPRKLYTQVLSWFGESESTIHGLMEIVDTRLHTHKAEQLFREAGFSQIHYTPYLINPNYEVKFGLKPREVWPIFRIPYIKDFYTTASYYLLKPAN